MTEKIHSGELYDSSDPELLREQFIYLDLMYDFNNTRPSDTIKQNELLQKMLGAIGKNSYITAPLYANWGGHHLHLGDNVYINFGLTLVDDTYIYIGDCCLLGPNVTIATAGHPILPELRDKTPLQYNLPVHIGRNCWIGAGAVIVPGITIGDNCVIGAGSIVVKDIPANTVAVGNPCKVIREINEYDSQYYHKGRKISK